MCPTPDEAPLHTRGGQPGPGGGSGHQGASPVHAPYAPYPTTARRLPRMPWPPRRVACPARCSASCAIGTMRWDTDGMLVQRHGWDARTATRAMGYHGTRCACHISPISPICHGYNGTRCACRRIWGEVHAGHCWVNGCEYAGWLGGGSHAAHLRFPSLASPICTMHTVPQPRIAAPRRASVDGYGGPPSATLRGLHRGALREA